MPKKPLKKPRLKSSPPPHVEVVDQNGLALPVNNMDIQENAEGIFAIKVEVQLPPRPTVTTGFGACFYRNDLISSSF